MQPDLILSNLKLFNVHLKKFCSGHLAIRGERIFGVYPEAWRDNCTSAEVVNGQGCWAIPGLIDIHLHVESSMVTPPFFAEALLRNGVTTAVADPHEIANVFGVEGIRAMLDASRHLDVDLFYQIPSCVPATDLETAGASIGIQELEELGALKEMLALGEVMDFVDVIHNPVSGIRRLVEAARAHNLIIEGHCPNLTGAELAAYMFFAADSDHTFQTVETIKHRIEQGMFIQIQEKSVYAETMRYLNNLQDFDYFALVTDDVMADDLAQRGHLNIVLQEAMRQGLAPEKAIYAATFAPAQRMRLYDRGALATGKLADMILLKDLESFEIQQVWKRGKLVRAGDSDHAQHFRFPQRYCQSVHVEPLTIERFNVPAPVQAGEFTCRVMEAQEHTTYTKEIHKSIPISDGLFDWQKGGVCLAIVFERHRNSQSAGYGFVTGACLQHGAVATTYAHDSHHLLVLGASPQDMLLAANTVIVSQGGIAVVEGNRVRAYLPLPVAGLMAEESVAAVGRRLAQVKQALIEQGYRHKNVIMSLSTLTLPVSPELKLSNRGLIHAPTRSLVSLIV